MAVRLYWIKERHNPQSGIYFIAYGNQLSKKEAKAKESSRYGNNFMYSFNTEKEYKAEIERLKKEGSRVTEDVC